MLILIILKYDQVNYIVYHKYTIDFYFICMIYYTYIFAMDCSCYFQGWNSSGGEADIRDQEAGEDGWSGEGALWLVSPPLTK